MGRIAVAGSVAWDTILVYKDFFKNNIKPDKIHMLNVSFTIDRRQVRRGGTGANISYNLALLGEHPILCAAVGSDFASYGQGLERLGVDLKGVLTCGNLETSQAYVTTDRDDNQISAFYPGAMAIQDEIDLTKLDKIEWFVLSPSLPKAMNKFIDQCQALGTKLIFSPGQMITSLDAEVLRKGLQSATVIVGNDYEHSLLSDTTGMSEDDMVAGGAIVVVTKGGQGSLIRLGNQRFEIPVAKVDQLVDPTGAGDAYLAGLTHALRAGYDLEISGRIGALAAAYAVEKMGPQEHFYTKESFAMRFQQSFGTTLPNPPSRELN